MRNLYDIGVALCCTEENAFDTHVMPWWHDDMMEVVWLVDQLKKIMAFYVNLGYIQWCLVLTFRNLW